MNIFNTAQFIKKPGANDDGEEPMLCMWQGKDVVSKSECLSVRWSNDGNLVAGGGGDGAVRIYDAKNNGQLIKHLGEPARDNSKVGKMSLPPEETPVMSMRWHPKMSGRLRTAMSNGTIELYDLKTKSSRQTTKEVDEQNGNKPNQTLAIDYHPSGDLWCSGGTDRVVRVYDEAAGNKPKLEMRGSLAGNRGHSNRICSVRFWPFNRNVVVTGGLDGTAMCWDTYGEMAGPDGEVPSLGEPYQTISDLDIRGDAIDFDDNTLLVGSWRPVAQLQFYDMRTGNLEKTIGWRKPRQQPYPVSVAKSRWSSVRDAVRGSCNIYAAQFIASGPNRGSFVAGGTGCQELKFFKKSAEDPENPSALLLQKSISRAACMGCT